MHGTALLLSALLSAFAAAQSGIKARQDFPGETTVNGLTFTNTAVFSTPAQSPEFTACLLLAVSSNDAINEGNGATVQVPLTLNGAVDGETCGINIDFNAEFLTIDGEALGAALGTLLGENSIGTESLSAGFFPGTAVSFEGEGQ